MFYGPGKSQFKIRNEAKVMWYVPGNVAYRTNAIEISNPTATFIICSAHLRMRQPTGHLLGAAQSGTGAALSFTRVRGRYQWMGIFP